MGITADSVTVELEAKVDRYSSDVKIAVGSFEDGMRRIDRAGTIAEDATRRLGSGIGTLQSILAGFAGGIASTLVTELPSALAGAASRAVEYASSLGETSQQLGVTTKFLQEFRFAATQSGASTEKADVALARLSKTIGDAAQGGKTATRAFTDIGVSLGDKDGNLKSSDQLFREVADAIAKISDPARQAAAAVAIFGRGGQALIPVLQGGAAGFNGFADAAQRAGLVLTDETINKLDALADKGAAIKQVITTQLAAAIGANADAILGLGRSAGNAIGFVSGLISQIEGLRRINGREGFFATLGASGQSAEAASTPQGYRKRLEAAVGDAEGLPSTRGRSIAIAQAKKELADYLNSPEYRAASVSLGLPAPEKAGGKVIAPAVKTPKTPRARAAAVDNDPLGLRDIQKSGVPILKDVSTRFEDLLPVGRSIKETFRDAFNLDPTVEILPSVVTGLQQITDEAARAHDAGKQFVDDLSTGLADAIINGKNLGDVLVNSIRRAAIEAAANAIFKQIGGAIGPGGFGSIGKILGFANGGNPPVGRVSIVGERGPELFVPNTAGTIYPNGTGPGGGGNTFVTQRFSLDLRGGVVTSDLIAQMNALADNAAVRGAAGGAALAQAQIGQRGRRSL